MERLMKTVILWKKEMTDLLLLGKPVLRSSGTTGVMVMRMN
jgi:hypothetical protein